MGDEAALLRRGQVNENTWQNANKFEDAANSFDDRRGNVILSIFLFDFK